MSVRTKFSHFAFFCIIGALLGDVLTIRARAQTLTVEQQTAIKALQTEAERKAAPTALHLADVVRKIYENNLSEAPDLSLRATLDAQMKDSVWQLLQVKGEAMWAAYRLLTPSQKALVRAEVFKDRPPTDLPDVMDIIGRLFMPNKH